MEAFAYYLPQFYPIPLNSTWWGEGFTEWVSVLRAHQGLRSPRGTTLTPGELGFYDLRSPEIRRAQADLVRASGLSSLCVYHYWSAGERLLPEVEDALLRDGQPDVPFFLGWANHDWTLAWKGRADQVTHRQAYDELDNDAHIEFLLEAMADARYRRLNGRPMLFVYDPLSIPRAGEVFERWRTVASRRGLDLFLLGGANRMGAGGATSLGLDAWVQGTSPVFGSMDRWERARHSLRGYRSALSFATHRDVFWPYAELARRFAESLADLTADTVPVVISSWNNTGRRVRRASSTDSTPEAFERALRSAIERAPVHGAGAGARRLVAINAWNEWGEGMTLEPSIEFGRGYLDALARVLRSD
ncbi:hypothetical protein GCM10027425_02970 [Alteromonas gracilis]